MAIETGQGIGPDKRAAWGPQMRKFLNPRAQAALEQALLAYFPYTSDQLDEDPALKLEVAKVAAPHIEAAVAAITISILQNFSRKGILKENFLDIASKLDLGIMPKYPELQTAGLRYSEAFVFNEIRQRVMSYLLTIIALRERDHRGLERKTDGYQGWRAVQVSEPIHGVFFQMIDHPEATIRGVIRSGGEAEGFRVREIINNYRFLRDVVIPFFRGRVAPFRNPDRKPKEKLMSENNRIAEILLREADREIPMCVLEGNRTLLEMEDPLTVQFTPMDDPRAGTFHTYFAQVDYLEGEYGQSVATDAGRQAALRPQVMRMAGIGERTMVANVGRIPALFVDRYKGELSGANFGPETLKLIAGQSPHYELLRRDILWDLAQLSCRRPVLQKMFGDAFAPRERAVRSHGGSVETGSPDQPKGPNPATDGERRYPSGEGSAATPQARAEALFGALEEGAALDIAQVDNGDGVIPPEDVEEAVDGTVERVQRESEVVGYRKLLPLIKKHRRSDDGSQENEFIAMKPSQKALSNAAAAGRELRRGMEFPELGQVFRPHEVPALLEKFGVTTLEELVAKYPDKAFIRYEGWVSPYKRGQAVHGVIETVKARVQQP